MLDLVGQDPESIDIFGQPPNVIKLKNGNLHVHMDIEKSHIQLKL